MYSIMGGMKCLAFSYRATSRLLWGLFFLYYTKDKHENIASYFCFVISFPFQTDQYPTRIGMECAIKTAGLFKTLEKTGIDEKQVSTSPDCHNDIKTEEPTPFDVSKSKFLLCDITIKNINMVLSDMNITLLSLVYLVPDKDELKLAGLPAYGLIPGNTPDYRHLEKEPSILQITQYPDQN